jgi:anion-transporting  ArsA/GET3 family ATPase
MSDLLARRLIVVTGKGGAGKTTIATALGLLAAREGRRAIVAELGDQHRLPALFERPPPAGSNEEIEIERDLWSTSIDPKHALFQWLHALGGRLSVRMLASSTTFNYFAAAAPGAKELVSMIRVRELCERDEEPAARAHGRGAGQDGRGGPRAGYDLVILDAPATGHALGMLHSPQTFQSIVRVGPLAEEARRVGELLSSVSRCAYVAVTHASEMAVAETLELEQGLREQLGRSLDLIVVNGTVPRRFTREELASLVTRRSSERLGAEARIADASVQAAHTVHERALRQQAQLARLRRRRAAAGQAPAVVTVPFQFATHLDAQGLRGIASTLARKL